MPCGEGLLQPDPRRAGRLVRVLQPIDLEPHREQSARTAQPPHELRSSADARLRYGRAGIRPMFAVAASTGTRMVEANPRSLSSVAGWRTAPATERVPIAGILVLGAETRGPASPLLSANKEREIVAQRRIRARAEGTPVRLLVAFEPRSASVTLSKAVSARIRRAPPSRSVLPCSRRGPRPGRRRCRRLRRSLRRGSARLRGALAPPLCWKAMSKGRDRRSAGPDRRARSRWSR